MLIRLNPPRHHRLPKLAYACVLDLTENSTVPEDLAMTVVVSKMAGAVHGSYNVEVRPGMVLPLSVIAINIAESGLGKTVANSKTNLGFEEFDKLREQMMQSELSRYQSRLDAHQSIRKGILKKIKRAAECNGITAVLSEELVEHDKECPLPPSQAKTNYSDGTFAGLIDGLSQWPNANLSNDESAFLVDNRLTNQISLINSCISGTSISLRTGKGQVTITEPRVNLLLQMQQSVFDRMMESYGVRLVSEGFFGRTLLCSCIPKSPGQYIRQTPNWSGADKFNARCLDLLLASVTDDGKPVPKRVLRFSPDAQRRFEREVQYIATLRQPGCMLEFFPELAAKAPENIAKMAAISHAFDGGEGDIPVNVLENAISVYGWYAEEQVRIFSKPPEPPQEFQDATRLMSWLANYVRTHGALAMERNFLLKNGPRATRLASRLTAALFFLWQRGIAQEQIKEGSKMVWVVLNPAHFTFDNIAYWCGPCPGFPN